MKKISESYKCKFCKKSFKKDDYLNQLEDHLKNFHNIQEKEFNQLLKPLIKTYKMKKEDVSNSKVGLSCIKTSKIKLHEKNGQSKNDDVKAFICSHCSKSYTTASLLNRHSKNVHNITLSPKKLKKKIAKSVITPDRVNKELKKVMKSKLEKEGKKNNQSTTVNQVLTSKPKLPQVTLVNSPLKKQNVTRK